MSVPSIASQPQPDTAAQELRRAYARLRGQLAAGALGVGWLCVWLSPVPRHAWPDVALLTALAVIANIIPVRLPSSSFFISPTVPIIFALAGLYGASAALLAAILSTIAGVFMFMPRRNWRRVQVYLPAVSTQVVSIGCFALMYLLMERLRFSNNGVRPGEVPEWRAWLALPACAFLSFIVNNLLSTTLASRYFGQRWDVIWHDNYRWMLPSALILSPVAFLTAVLYGQHWWLGAGFILLPVYALRMVVITHERTLAAYKHGVELLGRIMQEAHPYTHGHLHRVARWAKKIAEEMNLPPGSMQHIEDAAILHDIGKVAVDDRVLNKVGKLSDDDWTMIQKHPVTGADLVAQMSALGKVGHWIRHHHERPDGKGYPDQLQGDEIPIESCIISVVDAYDAMVGGPAKEDQRPYRQPMPPEAALEELRRHSGTQFHARVVEVFTTILLREQEMEARGLNLTPTSMIADDSLWAAPPQMPGTPSLAA